MTFKFVKPRFAWIVCHQMKAMLSLGSKFVDRKIYKEVKYIYLHTQTEINILLECEKYTPPLSHIGEYASECYGWKYLKFAQNSQHSPSICKRW